MAEVLHPTYLPFTAYQLLRHFAPVRGPGDEYRNVRYCWASADEVGKYDELICGGGKPTPTQTRLGRQMEKDERFWLATALMSLYHADGGPGRADLFRPPARANRAAGPRLASHAGRTRWLAPWTCSSKSISPHPPAIAPGSATTWANAMRSRISKSRPRRRGAAGRSHEGRCYAARPAERSSGHLRGEGALRYLGHVTFDLARNQLARNIDLMLEANPALTAPLSLRKRERIFLVLLTPTLTQPGPAGDAISKSRLYGWLMPACQDPDNPLLRQHLPRRDNSELAAASRRLGWASWED